MNSFQMCLSTLVIALAGLSVMTGRVECQSAFVNEIFYKAGNISSSFFEVAGTAKTYEVPDTGLDLDLPSITPTALNVYVSVTGDSDVEIISRRTVILTNLTDSSAKLLGGSLAVDLISATPMEKRGKITVFDSAEGGTVMDTVCFGYGDEAPAEGPTDCTTLTGGPVGNETESAHYQLVNKEDGKGGYEKSDFKWSVTSDTDGTSFSKVNTNQTFVAPEKSSAIRYSSGVALLVAALCALLV